MAPTTPQPWEADVTDYGGVFETLRPKTVLVYQNGAIRECWRGVHRDRKHLPVADWQCHLFRGRIAVGDGVNVNLAAVLPRAGERGQVT